MEIETTKPKIIGINIQSLIHLLCSKVPYLKHYLFYVYTNKVVYMCQYNSLEGVIIQYPPHKIFAYSILHEYPKAVIVYFPDYGYLVKINDNCSVYNSIGTCRAIDNINTIIQDVYPIFSVWKSEERKPKWR